MNRILESQSSWIRWGVSPKVVTLVVPEDNPAFKHIKAGADFSVIIHEGSPALDVRFGGPEARKGWERFRTHNDPDTSLEHCVQIHTKYVKGHTKVETFMVRPAECIRLDDFGMTLRLPQDFKPVAHQKGGGGARKMQFPKKGQFHPIRNPNPLPISESPGTPPVDVGEALPCGETIELESSPPKGRHLSLASVIRALNRYKDAQGERVQFQILENGHLAADVVVRRRIGS